MLYRSKIERYKCSIIEHIYGRKTRLSKFIKKDKKQT